jgi:hypothetical protein
MLIEKRDGPSQKLNADTIPGPPCDAASVPETETLDGQHETFGQFHRRQVEDPAINAAFVIQCDLRRAIGSIARDDASFLTHFSNSPLQGNASRIHSDARHHRVRLCGRRPFQERDNFMRQQLKLDKDFYLAVQKGGDNNFRKAQ